MSERRFTDAQVVEMRALYRGGMSYAEIARRFDWGAGQVHRTVAGICYADVPGMVTSRERKVIEAARREEKRRRSEQRRFTPEQVVAMRKLHALGWSTRRIARKLGAPHKTVHRAVSGEHYAEIAQ